MHTGHRDCSRREAGPLCPQAHWWEREVPKARKSVLEAGKDREIARSSIMETSERHKFESSISRRNRHDPISSIARGFSGPEAAHSSGDVGRRESCGRGKGAVRLGGPMPRLHARFRFFISRRRESETGMFWLTRWVRAVQAIS